MTAALAGIPRGLRLMAGGALSFSIMSALLKLAGETLPLFEIVTGRSLVVAVLCAVAVRRQGHSFIPTPSIPCGPAASHRSPTWPT